MASTGKWRMKLVDRYIIKTVFVSLALVVFILTGLQGFILFVNQLGDIGKAEYGTLQALVYVSMQLPAQVYLFFPIASLLGCLVGLGVMATQHELVVLRAAGMSMGQITLAIFKMGVIVIAMMTILGEMVFPKLVLRSHDYKVQAMHGGRVLQTNTGVWLHTGQDILLIGKMLSPTHIEQIEQFHFDQSKRLQFVRSIEMAIQTDGQWLASAWKQTNLSPTGTTVEQAQHAVLEIQLDSRLLLVSQQEPEQMTFWDLHQFLSKQTLSRQNLRNFELGYWQRIVLPFTTLVMMMLGIPFVFGPLRSSSMGIKLMSGALIGFGFYILNKFCGSLSQIYQFSALLAAVGPTIVFAGLGIGLLRVKQ